MTNSLKILVIDDSEFALDQMAEALDQEKHHILKAQNGKQALEIFSNHRDIAIIFTDINMPVMNGIDFCKELNKANDVIPPIIAVTTEVDANYKSIAKELGIVSWLIKPINHNVLPQIIQQLVK